MERRSLFPLLLHYSVIGLSMWLLFGASACTFLSFGAQTPPQSPLQIETIHILEEPLVGQAFRVEVPVVSHAQVPLSPVTLTFTIPSSLNFVELESGGRVISQREEMVHFPDPVGWGEIKTKGQVISIDLGTMEGPEGKAKKTVILVIKPVVSGEWQIEGEVMWRDKGSRNAVGDVKRVVGWSTPFQGVWEDFEVVETRWLKEEDRQCGGRAPCLVVYPEEPLHYFLGISEKEMPGQLLRPRTAKMCNDSTDLFACFEQNTPSLSPTPESWIPIPPPTRPPSTLEIRGRITFLDEGHRARPVSGAKVEVWDKALSPLECPPPGPTPPPSAPPIHICEDRLLATLFTDDNGIYRVVLKNLDQDGSGLDPYIVVYTTDQARVSVKHARWDPPYHKESGLIVRDSQGGYLHYDMMIKEENISRAFHIYDQIRRVGFGKLREKVGWAPSQMVTVYWPHPCVFVDNACYYYGALHIPSKFYRGRIFDDDVLLHEFGHFIMSQMYGSDNYVVYACPGFSHYLNAHETKRCAWSEGWATFFQAMLQDQPDYVSEAGRIYIDLESPAPIHLPPASEPPVSNADNETAVAAILWDIYDGIDATTEPADRLADGVNNGTAGQGIWDLVNNIRAGFPAG